MKGVSWLFVVLTTLTISSSQITTDRDQLLNWCLDGKYHKTKPGPEDMLHSQCTPWRKRSCCSHNTTVSVHAPGHLNFNFDHCGDVQKLSDSCRRHFIQDLCFFECTPNGGPWIVKVDMKTRKEKYFNIPLCSSDCNSWFEACKNDYTCTDNWIRNFMWSGGTNVCRNESQCRTFQTIFKTAENLCEKVWDHSWQVVDDSKPCMRIWFDGEKGNPNDKVTEYYVNELTSNKTSSTRWFFINWFIFNLHFLLVLIVLK